MNCGKLYKRVHTHTYIYTDMYIHTYMQIYGGTSKISLENGLNVDHFDIEIC